MEVMFMNSTGNLSRAYKGKRVLITGGLGMLGSSLAHVLHSCGAKITLADANILPYGANRFNVRDIIDKVDLQLCDIRYKDLITQLIRDKDYIFNFAGQVSHNDSMINPILDAEINYLGHINVLEACKEHNHDARIFFTGSRLQFGPIAYIPVDETHPMKPQTPYAVNKAAAEEYYMYCSRQHRMRTTCFRIANPYGPRSQMMHSKYTILNWFLRQAMENKIIPIYGDGTQVRDYIYIDDLVHALVLAGANDKSIGQVYNVGSGQGTKFRDAVEIIIKIVGKGKIKNLPWPKDYLNVETGNYITDLTKIKSEIGFFPRTSLEHGLMKTYKFYKKYHAHYW